MSPTHRRLTLLWLGLALLVACSSPTVPAPILPPPDAQVAGAAANVPAQRVEVQEYAVAPSPEPENAPPALAECPPQSPRRLQVGRRDELVRGDSAIPEIALTFDAGAGSGTILDLLDVLLDRGVHSTFFIAGAFADRYPRILERISADGHELANHSYTHPDFANLTEKQIRDELHRATIAIERASGAQIAPLWRPPFGSRNDRVLQVVESEGFRSIYWTFDSGDWIEGMTQRQITNTDLSKAGNGAVVVHHVSPDITARAMPTIIDTLRDRGFSLVTVSEILGYDSACLPKLG